MHEKKVFTHIIIKIFLVILHTYSRVILSIFGI